MKVLFLGHYNEGSTSRMRGEYLKEILSPNLFKIINIDIPIASTPNLFKSIGWRYKFGPLINNINSFIINSINNDWNYDFVWVEKGVFVKPEIIFKLKNNSNKLVHFTPDPAFTYHQSKFFYKAIHIYDYCITTKSFEMDSYIKYGSKNTLFCTQGFDSRIHKPSNSFEEKIYETSFVGHYEKDRGVIIQNLIDNKIQVVLAGIKWEKFYENNKNNSYLIYLGNGVYGNDYAKLISNSYYSFGLLSSWIPEKHTTRTFEIPACGTCLITPVNNETSVFFSKDDVLFYNKTDEIPMIIKSNIKNKLELKKITNSGFQKVVNGNYEYKKIIESLLNIIMK